ncbi:MAG: ATP-dependent transcriptional regulator [Symbiobacteriaceae bacterium]|jgi:LuxR family maltose regulon positive regulatory protein|nr:ATP-dependent transcriptional regulator [Symbiobacteriaceae bacterium]
MPQPIGVLQTKLYIPQARPGAVPRRELWDLLHTALDRRITLVTAPAGFGKTTLVSQWLDHLGDRRPGAAWVSLEPPDDTPQRFWSYVADALAPAAPEAAQALKGSLQGPDLPAPELLLLPVINRMLATDRQIIIVLDDYHVIQSPVIHEAVAFWVEHLPPAVHLILLSRGDPPLPLARWRARGDLTELRAQDLRFSRAEAASFLNGAKGLALAEPLIAALHDRTEGWVTGLQLAALSLKGSQNPDGFVSAFTGSHRYVLDYLMEEVLAHQPAAVQQFLLKTSVLSRLSAPLCAAVTGMADSHQMLQSLEEADLFILSLDEERRWYRYHHLFADMLRAHLLHAHADEVTDLQLRASDWFARAGHLADAVAHALAAQAWDRAADLLEEATESTWADGQLHETLLWLEALPAEVLRARPRLSLLYARALIPAGKAGLIAQLVAGAAAALGEAADLPGQVTAMQAQLARLQGDTAEAMRLSRLALDQLLPTDRGWRGLTSLSMGGCHRLAGQLTEARQAYGQAAIDCGAAGNRFLTLTAANLQAEVCQQQGQLRRALAAFRTASRQAPAHLPVAGWSLVGEGGVLREWNQLDEAAEVLMRGIDLGRQGRLINVVVPGQIELARVLLARGDIDEAAQLLALAEKAARASGIPRALGRVIPWQVRLLLMQGDVAGAAALLESMSDGSGETTLAHLLALARIQITADDRAAALGTLARLRREAEATQEDGARLEGMLLEALCLRAQGQSGPALRTVDGALALAEPEGYVRLFLDEGPEMMGLLAQVRGPREGYARQLLAAAGGGATPGGLVEPLSDRELEVLRLIAEGASNQAIAERLFISINTVKKHTTNIFGKLGAESRTQATVQARLLGYL